MCSPMLAGKKKYTCTCCWLTALVLVSRILHLNKLYMHKTCKSHLSLCSWWDFLNLYSLHANHTPMKKYMEFVNAAEVSPLLVWACCPLALDPYCHHSFARMMVPVREVINARPMKTEGNSAELPQAVLWLMLGASLQHLKFMMGEIMCFSQCF